MSSPDSNKAQPEDILSNFTQEEDEKDTAYLSDKSDSDPIELCDDWALKRIFVSAMMKQRENLVQMGRVPLYQYKFEFDYQRRT